MRSLDVISCVDKFSKGEEKVLKDTSGQASGAHILIGISPQKSLNKRPSRKAKLVVEEKLGEAKVWLLLHLQWRSYTTNMSKRENSLSEGPTMYQRSGS